MDQFCNIFYDKYFLKDWSSVYSQRIISDHFSSLGPKWRCTTLLKSSLWFFNIFFCSLAVSWKLFFLYFPKWCIYLFWKFLLIFKYQVIRLFIRRSRDERVNQWIFWRLKYLQSQFRQQIAMRQYFCFYFVFTLSVNNTIKYMTGMFKKKFIDAEKSHWAKVVNFIFVKFRISKK